MPNIINCPECGSDTVLRKVQKGKKVGQEFYVCTRYPQCKGRVPIGEQMGTTIPSEGRNMFCSNCGIQLPDDSRFCSDCGIEINTLLPSTSPASAQTKTLEKRNTGFFAPEKAGINKGVVGGIIMMVIAAVWFGVAWEYGWIFFYPPILFLIGLFAFIKGIVTGNISGKGK